MEGGLWPVASLMDSGEKAVRKIMFDCVGEVDGGANDVVMMRCDVCGVGGVSGGVSVYASEAPHMFRKCSAGPHDARQHPR